MQAETISILLFSIAAVVAIAVRQLHVSYTVALVLTGLALTTLILTPVVDMLPRRPRILAAARENESRPPVKYE